MKKELEEQLREGGEKVSAGRIRIDSKRALQRLRDFRFSDPSHWILEVLRAAAESGAKKISVETDADDVTVVFDGDAFPDAAMRELLERALEPGTTRDEKRTRLLALGVAGCLGAGAAHVTVESGSQRVVLKDDDVKLEEREGKTNTTRVHLHKAFGWRVMSGFFRGSPEAKAVEERCWNFPAGLTLNGKKLGGEPKREKHLVHTALESKRHRLVADFDPRATPSVTSTLHLLVSGVQVATRHPVLTGLPLVAVLDCAELRRNASGSDVIDDDDVLVESLNKLNLHSLALLADHHEPLSEQPTWRRAFLERLLDEKLPKPVRVLLRKAPLVPGPAGEFSSLEELNVAREKKGVVFVAERRWAKGSYPEPTVLLTDFRFAEALLPEGKRVDVEKQVRAREYVAEARVAHEAQPLVEQVLAGQFQLVGPINGMSCGGQIGLDHRERGAYVRVLAEGRPFVSGELTALAPLKLRAIVNWQRALGDSFFEPGGDEKLLGLVLRAVEQAAVETICKKLDDPAAATHAFDLLTRFANRGAKRNELPPELRAAKLFSCRGDKFVSLNEIFDWQRCAYVRSRGRFSFLNGNDVLVLEPAEVALLERLTDKRFNDATDQLAAEEKIRRRMDGPPEPARITEPVLVRVDVNAAGVTGQVGLPIAPDNKLTLTVLKNGLRLETTQLTARYHCAIACIDSPDVLPNDNWNAVVRGNAWRELTTVVQNAERKLAAELVKLPREKWGTSGERYMAQFLAKTLIAFDPSSLDDVTSAVVNAKVFDAGPRRVSLLELKRAPRLLSIPATPWKRPTVPAELMVLLESKELVAVLSDVLGRPVEDGTLEVEQWEARRRLASLPELPFTLGSQRELEVRVTGTTWNAVVGFRDDLSRSALIDVRVQSRSYLNLARTAPLPLDIVLEAPLLTLSASRSLAGSDEPLLSEVVTQCAQALLEHALRSRDTIPEAREVLLVALGRRFDSDELRELPLLKCTDGTTRSAEQLEEPLQFVRDEKLTGTLPDGRPIVIANSANAREALERFKRITNVEDALRLQLKALRQREAIKAVAEVKCSADSMWRQHVSESGITGEVVIAREGGGRLELFYEKKPLCVLESALPMVFSAAIDSPRLRPRPGFTGVEADAGFTEVIELVKASGARLAEKVANESIPPEWESTLVRLAFQLAAEDAWQWKGKKKKSKRIEPPMSRALVRKPLLRLTDGSSFSVHELMTLQLEFGRVAFARRRGAFIDGRRAWWPRPEEEGLASLLSLNLRRHFARSRGSRSPTRAAEVRTTRRTARQRMA